MKLGETFPAFSATTNLGKIENFHEWMGSSWAILFSHPADYTPVCTTELARAAQLAEQFRDRNVQMIALSCDSAESHRGWIGDIVAYANSPIITSKFGEINTLLRVSHIWSCMNH
ncbi:Thioredoxin domain-containing protein, partial [Trichostrongylus colubriformis]